jgi:ABC-type glycerol-3-phosphate transport system substrate-binding protein
MPTRKSLADGWLAKFPQLKPFLDGAAYAHKWQFTPGFQSVLDTTNNEILSVFSGNQTPEGALKTIESVGNEVLSKSKGAAGGAATMQATMQATAAK